MKFKHSEYLDTPHGNTTVWRYMGLDKFLDLLTQQRIYFTNARNFTDGYEVSLPQNIVRNKRKQLKQEGLTGRDLEEELAVFEWNHQPMRDLTLVNCWSIGRHESFALWKIYLAGAKSGIAIRTNISSIKKAIDRGKDSYPEDIYIGKVKYTDFLPEESLTRFHLITTKREFYEYEKEVRFFILHFPKSEGGVKPPYDLSAGRYVKVDIETLIDQIYLSPFIGKWFEESIKSLVRKTVPSLENRIATSAIIDQ
jgi:hypothetical protein